MARSNEAYLIASEYQILSFLIKNPDTFSQELKIYDDDFPHKGARAIFNALKILYNKHEEFQSFSILREANYLDEDVTISIIEQILSTEITVESIESALQVLKKNSVKYKLQNKLQKLQESLEEEGELDSTFAQALLWESQQLVLNAGEKTDSKELPQCIDEYKEDLQKRIKGDYRSFGDDFLDENLTRKASGGQIILISATTGMGKSAYSLTLVNNMINMNTPAMYFTLEMDTISTMDRLIAMRRSIPIKDLYNRENISSLLKIMDEEKVLLEKTQFRMVDAPNMSLSRVQSLIQEFKSFYKVDYVCVFIDLITQVKEFIDLQHNGSLASTIEKGVNQLNEIAKSENVCFVCVAQMKRETDAFKISKITDVEKFRPILGHIKNSGALAERSRVVLSIFRRRPYIETYLPDSPELEYMQDIMEVSILKQNQGGLGIGKYLFNGSVMKTVPFVDED